MLDPQTFREAMSRLGAAVNIITTDGFAGRCGYTATAVCSVSAEPPSLLVCLNRSSQMHTAFLRNRVLAVNVLTAELQHLSPRFAGQDGMAMPDRFAEPEWHTLATGAPVHAKALCQIDCHIASVAVHGSHSIMFCDVADVRLADGDPLMYWARNYHSLVLHHPARA
jgi:flavin reductase